MEYKHRYLEDKILRLARAFPVITLCGARQAGKSTLLDHLFGQTVPKVVFDPVIDVLDARRDPELFFKLHPPPIILDEIQHAPELVPVVKRIVDERPGENGLFFITGSQQFSVVRAISESLAGRTAMLDLPTMGSGEIYGAPPDDGTFPALLENPNQDILKLKPRTGTQNLPSLIFKGGYPRTLDMDIESSVAWFDGYLKTYIERDIRTLGAVGDLHSFTRFVKLCAQLTAREVNYSQLGREIGMDLKTAKSWLSMLKASYQWFELPPYSGNTIKRLSGKPKGHFSDTGFASFLSAVFSPAALVSHPLFGHLFETYAVGEILKKLQVLPAMPALHHWRAHSGAEVDLLIEKDGWFWPVEVKLAARPSLRDARGLNAYEETYPKSRVALRIVISGGDEVYYLDKRTVVIPVTAV
jgi:predicted AAA+ superfamily ATPase